MMPQSSGESLEAALRAHVEFIAEERHPLVRGSAPASHHAAVKKYMREHFDKCGGQSELRHFDEEGVKFANIVLKIPGADDSLPPILVTANFDSPAGCPGADGNASGCAVLLELASLLLASSHQGARRTVWLVAFDLKEWGNIGSYALAKEMRGRDAQVK